MAEMWKPKAKVVYQEWIDTIISEAQDKLNTWEMNFIADMDIKLSNGQQLTQLQAEKLESIYADKTS